MDRRQSLKTPNLARITRSLRRFPKIRPRTIRPQFNGSSHGEVLLATHRIRSWSGLEPR
jgi:hypothetical protein